MNPPNTLLNLDTASGVKQPTGYKMLQEIF
jgi:hypothetical protein